MLDSSMRAVILELRKKGHGRKKIARALGISRNTVKKVLRSGSKEAPKIEREEKLLPHLDRVRELHAVCRGNLVRVHEELEHDGVEIPYSSLTSFCRRYGIGVKEKRRSGRYYFRPGQEMQHDTSPHKVEVGGRERNLQCASEVMCYSRMIFIQIYEVYNRFLSKVFLTDAFKYFQGVAERCMIDNTSVIVAYGTGKNAVMAPEMDSFAKRFDFKFEAHEVGDANRSGRVERPFSFIEGNFYPGRTFEDLKDLNKQARDWCDQVNHSFKRHIQAKPIELFQAERPYLKPLPIFIPEVYALHERIVDVEGYVALHTNRYSAPDKLIGRRVQVKETKDRVGILHNHKEIVEHERQESGSRLRMTLPEHRFTGRWKKKPDGLPASPEEKALRQAAPELGKLVDILKRKKPGRPLRHIRKLYRMFIDYPTETLCKAVTAALNHGLFDLGRIERMVLRSIAGDFFRLSINQILEEDDTDGR